MLMVFSGLLSSDLILTWFIFLKSGSVINQAFCLLFSFVLVCDATQEQYELVYKAVVELFKRQLDVIMDKHSGAEVNFKLDILSILKKYLILVKGSQINYRT